MEDLQIPAGKTEVKASAAKLHDSDRQAILTRYHNPTDKRWSRISATCDAGRVILNYDQALTLSANHLAAAKALADKLEWPWVFVGGSLPTGDFAWVDADKAIEADRARFAALLDKI